MTNEKVCFLGQFMYKPVSYKGIGGKTGTGVIIALSGYNEQVDIDPDNYQSLNIICDPHEVKPILIPFSSMTDEHAIELAKLALDYRAADYRISERTNNIVVKADGICFCILCNSGMIIMHDSNNKSWYAHNYVRIQKNISSWGYWPDGDLQELIDKGWAVKKEVGND